MPPLELLVAPLDSDRRQIPYWTSPPRHRDIQRRAALSHSNERIVVGVTLEHQQIDMKALPARRRGNLIAGHEHRLNDTPLPLLNGMSKLERLECTLMLDLCGMITKRLSKRADELVEPPPTVDSRIQRHSGSPNGVPTPTEPNGVCVWVSTATHSQIRQDGSRSRAARARQPRAARRR